jgi:hypothetical protein
MLRKKEKHMGILFENKGRDLEQYSVAKHNVRVIAQHDISKEEKVCTPKLILMSKKRKIYEKSFSLLHFILYLYQITMRILPRLVN